MDQILNTLIIDRFFTTVEKCTRLVYFCAVTYIYFCKMMDIFSKQIIN